MKGFFFMVELLYGRVVFKDKISWMVFDLIIWFLYIVDDRYY